MARQRACLCRSRLGVYGVDLLGFGASAQPSLLQDNRTWAQQVLHLIEQRIQQPVVIVGHSLGALVALTAAVSRPALVKALVLAPLQDPTLLEPPPRPRRSWRRFGQRLLMALQRWLVPWRLILWLFSRPWLLGLGLKTAYHQRHRVDQPLLRLFARPLPSLWCCQKPGGHDHGHGRTPAGGNSSRTLAAGHLPCAASPGAEGSTDA